MSGAIQEIVVTGRRIVRRGFSQRGIAAAEANANASLLRLTQAMASFDPAPMSMAGLREPDSLHDAVRLAPAPGVVGRFEDRQAA